MIDLESLGQEPGSVITSIAAVQFDIRNGQIGKTFEYAINMDSCLESKLKIDPSTVLWWLQQSEQSRIKFVNDQKNAIHLSAVLFNFMNWFTSLGFSTDQIYVWGRGPRFDMGLLSYAYKTCGYNSTPWLFRNERCVRTMESLYPEIKSRTKFEGILHNGTDDAKHQIKYVSEIFNNLIQR